MAGLGRKVFSAGEVLTAANVQGYLADQAVMRFASSAARATAIGTATEGMVSYLDDINETQQFNGTSWEGLVTTTNVGSLAPQGNAIINGGFDINQRAFTTLTVPGASSGVFVADRWYNSKGGTTGSATWSYETFTPGTAPVAGYEGKNYIRLVTSGYTNADSWASNCQQKIEDVRSFAGQTITVSFWAKAATGTPKIGLRTSQVFGTGGSPSLPVNQYATVNITTSWVRYSQTFNIGSLAGKTLGTVNDSSLILAFVSSAGSTTYDGGFGSMLQNNTFDIWGIQLEAGSVATPFKRNAPSVQAELAACQRYYWRTEATIVDAAIGQGFASSTTASVIHVPLPVSMRTKPAAVDFAGGVLSDGVTATNTTNLVLSSTSTQNVGLLVAQVASGLTQYRPYRLISGSPLTNFVGFSAEL